MLSTCHKYQHVKQYTGLHTNSLYFYFTLNHKNVWFQSFKLFVNTVKPVYNGQLRGIIKLAFVDKWPLFKSSETTYPMFTGQIKTGLCRQEITIRRCPYAHV